MRHLALLPLLLTIACAHQQRHSQPLPELPRYSLQSRLADVPEDEGSGGYLPSVPYYVAHETLAQAEAPVGADGWLARAFNYTATAPASSNAFIQNDLAKHCLNGTTCTNYLRGNSTSAQLNGASTTDLLTGGTIQWYVDGSALQPGTDLAEDLGTSARRVKDIYTRDITANAASGANAYAIETNGARFDLGTGASDYLSSDGSIITSATHLSVAGNVIATGQLRQNGSGAGSDNVATGIPFVVNDAEGLQLSSTAALPTCAVGIEGTLKRDGTTGAASTARTRVCLCTSDGAASPAYAWVNVVSGTVGTTTTCAP